MQTYLKDIVEGIGEWCGDSADSSAVCIFHGIRGSKAYGTDIATSDTDTHGLYTYPSIMYAGLEIPKEQIQDKKGDNVFYGLKRYFNLAMSANPNLIEILYSPDDCVLYKSDMFDFLVRHRSLFMSKKCYNSFTGYAVAQIKKAKGKNKKVHSKDKFFKEDAINKLSELFFEGSVSRDWIETIFCPGIFGFITKGKEYSNDLKGIKKDYKKYLDEDMKQLTPPTRLDHTYIFPKISPRVRGYDAMPCRPVPLKDHRKHNVNIDKCHASSVEHMPNYYRLYHYPVREGVKGVFMGGKVVCQSIPKEDEWLKHCGTMYVNEIAFQQSLKDYKSYWDWMANRNDSRWIDQENHSDLDFDKKNMQHTIRLLYSGINILENGEPIVRFSGEKLKFLRDIRDGKYDYEYLINYAEKLDEKAKKLYEATDLPEDVDRDKLNKLYLDMVKNSDVYD